jgi:phosphoribosyl-ATP pyrophosphohydrolase
MKAVLEEAKRPLNFWKIEEHYNEKNPDKRLSEEGVRFVLNAMLKDDHSVVKTKDVADGEVWHLTDAEGPKDINHYKELVRQLLTKHGPMTSGGLNDKLMEEHHVVYDVAEYVIDQMKEADPPELVSESDEFLYYPAVRLPDQHLPVLNDYMERIYKMIQHEPMNSGDIRRK